MRRVLMAVALVSGGLPGLSQAESLPITGGSAADCIGVEGASGSGYRYPTYVRRLRGGYGVNGYAPVWGPVWGPEAFIPPPGLPPYARSPYECLAEALAEEARERGLGLPIKIVHNAEAGVTLNYSVNEYDYVIKPGESQSLVNDQQWVLSFDRGGDFGTSRHTLLPGTYTFFQTETGWDVRYEANAATLASRPVVKNPLPERPAIIE